VCILGQYPKLQKPFADRTRIAQCWVNLDADDWEWRVNGCTEVLLCIYWPETGIGAFHRDQRTKFEHDAQRACVAVELWIEFRDLEAAEAFVGTYRRERAQQFSCTNASIGGAGYTRRILGIDRIDIHGKTEASCVARYALNGLAHDDLEPATMDLHHAIHAHAQVLQEFSLLGFEVMRANDANAIRIKFGNGADAAG